MDEIFAVGCAVLLMGGAAAIVKIVEAVRARKKREAAERWNHMACFGMCDNCVWEDCPSAKK